MIADCIIPAAPMLYVTQLDAVRFLGGLRKEDGGQDMVQHEGCKGHHSLEREKFILIMEII